MWWIVPSERWGLLKIGPCCCLCQAVPGHLLARLPPMTERNSLFSPRFVLLGHLSCSSSTFDSASGSLTFKINLFDFPNAFFGHHLWVFIHSPVEQSWHLHCEIFCGDKVPVGGTLCLLISGFLHSFGNLVSPQCFIFILILHQGGKQKSLLMNLQWKEEKHRCPLILKHFLLLKYFFQSLAGQTDRGHLRLQRAFIVKAWFDTWAWQSAIMGWRSQLWG